MSRLNAKYAAISNAAQAGRPELSIVDAGLAHFPDEILQYDDAVGCIRLSLKGNHIPELPPGIGRMQDLIELNLEDNCLTKLTPMLGLCQSLKYIDLDGNRQLFRNDYELHQAWNRSKPFPKNFPDPSLARIQYCKTGRQADQILQLLRSRIPPGVDTSMYTNGGTHSHSNTMVPAGVVSRGAPLHLYDDYGLQDDVAQHDSRDKRVVSFNNERANRINYRPHDQWGANGGEDYKPMKARCAMPPSKLDVVGDVLQKPQDPSEIRWSKRQAQDRKVGNDKVVGLEWGQNDAASAKPLVRVVNPESELRPFGQYDEQNALAPKKRVLKMAGPHLIEQHNVMNGQRGMDHDGSDDYRVVKRIVGRPKDSLQFDQAYDGDAKPRGWKAIGGAPKDQFSLAPDGKVEEQRRKMKPVQDRLTRTNADEFMLNHGETNQINAYVRKYGGDDEQQQQQRSLQRQGSMGLLNNVEFKTLSQLRKPPHGNVVNAVITDLLTNNPTKQFNALDTLRAIAMERHQNLLEQHIRTITPEIIKCMNNPIHTNLAINAMICVADLYSINPKSLPDVDAFLPTLLRRCTCNEQLQKYAKSAIVAIATKCMPQVVLPKLYAHASGMGSGNPLEMGWACYGIREAIISMNNSYFTQPATQHLADCLGVLTNLMFKNGEQFEGVRRLAGDTYDELCVCCADSMPELESKLQQLNIPAMARQNLIARARERINMFA